MVKLIALLENTACAKEYKSKHGLSVYIETPGHRILFDLGPDGTFLENAKKLGVDISAVDTVFISHGHYDHGGGLKAFMKENDTARIYIKSTAFEKHFTKVAGIPCDIGIDAELKKDPRFVLVDGDMVIDDELSLFSGVTGRRLYSSVNDKLLAKEGGKTIPDRFEHEMDLIVTDEGKDVLVTGCSHNGIVNIIEKYDQLKTEGRLTLVVGGFHLFSPSSGKYESEELITGVAQSLNEIDARFLTCHCTGVKAYDIMKAVMGEKLGYFATGDMTQV